MAQAKKAKAVGINHVAFISRFGGMPATLALRSLQLLAPGALTL